MGAVSSEIGSYFFGRDYVEKAKAGDHLFLYVAI